MRWLGWPNGFAYPGWPCLPSRNGSSGKGRPTGWGGLPGLTSGSALPRLSGLPNATGSPKKTAKDSAGRLNAPTGKTLTSTSPGRAVSVSEPDGHDWNFPPGSVLLTELHAGAKTAAYSHPWPCPSAGLAQYVYCLVKYAAQSPARPAVSLSPADGRRHVRKLSDGNQIVFPSGG